MPGPNETQRAALDEAMRLINQQPMHILWFCGHLSTDQRAQVQRIARRAGIALADSITQPGSIGPYQHGEYLPNYLGPLSLYGFSRRIYKFLHTDHEINDTDSQCVFFIKSKVDQATTPFSEGKLKRQLKVVQVNHNPGTSRHSPTWRWICRWTPSSPTWKAGSTSTTRCCANARPS